MIYAVVNEKGGSGKTTLASNLAVLLARDAEDLLLIDGDPQRSLSKFVAARHEEGVEPSLTCVQLTKKAIVQEGRKLAKNHKTMLIDVVGRDDAGFRAALLLANVVVVPILPSQFDLWVAEELPEALDQARIFNPDLVALAVLNGCDTNPVVRAADETAELIRDIPGLKLLDLRIGWRRAYKKAPESGKAVCELTGADKNYKALQEMFQLYQEVTHAALPQA